MKDQGHLAYDDGLLCLITGGSGHMDNVPIEVFEDAADILQYDEVVITADLGEVTIRTPKQQAIADNDATILQLIRELRGDTPWALRGKYLIVLNLKSTKTEGVISEAFWYGLPLSPCIILDSGAIIEAQVFAIDGIQVILAENKEEANKILADRQAAIRT